MSDSSHCQLLFSLSLSSRAFLNMHALLFFCLTTLQKSNGCPLFMPLFSSATLLYLWLTQFPGQIHPAVWRLGQENVLQTDRQTQKAHQPASVNASALPVGVPTHSYYENSLSLLFLSQTRLLLLLFARDGCRSGRAYCTLHTSCSSTILFTVQFNLMREPETQPLSHPFILYSQGGKKTRQIHHGQKSGFSHIFPQESRDAACVFI